MNFPAIDPIAFTIGPLAVRWYSLSYIIGILIGLILINKFIITYKKNITKNDVYDLLNYLILGILIGGRLGYVFFYNLEFYFYNPFEILKIWNGGMSFHGGLLGIIISSFLFSKKNNKDIFIFLDLVSITAPIGIFLGRISNFINGELVGKITNSNWGVLFPNYDDKLRHPSQLYEAFLEGIVLFVLMNLIFFNKNNKVGTCSIMFLILYGCFRITSEIFREPDLQVGYLFGNISMGMFLSVFMIIAGFIIYFKRKNEIYS